MATAYLPSEYVFTSNPTLFKVTGLSSGQRVKVTIRDTYSSLLLGTFYFKERNTEVNFDLSGILNTLTAAYFNDYVIDNSTINEGRTYRQLTVLATNEAGSTTYINSVFICVFGGKSIADSNDYRCGNAYGAGSWLTHAEKIEYYAMAPVMLSFLSAFTIASATSPVSVYIRVTKRAASGNTTHTTPVTINRARSVQSINIKTLLNQMPVSSDIKWYEVEVMYGNPLSPVTKPMKIFLRENIYNCSDVYMLRWLNHLGGYDHAFLQGGSESITAVTETAKVYLDSIEQVGNRYPSTHKVMTKSVRETKKFGRSSIDKQTFDVYKGIAESISVQLYDKATGLWQNVECVDSSFAWNHQNELNDFETTIVFPEKYTQNN